MIFKTLYDAAKYIYPYIAPSCNNLLRTVTFIGSTILVPMATIAIPYVFFKEWNEDSNPHNNSTSLNNSTPLPNQTTQIDIVMYLTFAGAASILQGLQQGLAQYLQVSTMQAIRKENMHKLMSDEAKFLVHGSTEDIKSIQYVTVGEGVRNFAQNTIPMFTTLPSAAISALTTIAYVGLITKSPIAVGTVAGFAASSSLAMFAMFKVYSNYNVSNQKVENGLVGKVNFIEAHRSPIQLMGSAPKEHQFVIESLREVDASIHTISLSYFLYFMFNSLSPVIASQFFGICLTGSNAGNISGDSDKILNVMIMSLLINTNTVSQVLSNNYSYIKLNLEQLKAFERAYDDCVATRSAHNHMGQEFQGDHLSLRDFSVYRPDPDNPQDAPLVAVFNRVTIELEPNTIYKLVGPSGTGKTTFLKAITNNWQYTDGVVTLPENADGAICFIPQHSFIPKGTLLDILTYRLQRGTEIDPRMFAAILADDGVPDASSASPRAARGGGSGAGASSSSGAMAHLQELTEREPLLSRGEAAAETRVRVDTPSLTGTAIALLTKVRLIPDVIRAEELEAPEINWSERLSGGEKQKIGIIQALLANPRFIVMDESASALDRENKQMMYRLIKSYVDELENYTVIYTDHDHTERFADATVTIVGGGLDLGPVDAIDA